MRLTLPRVAAWLALGYAATLALPFVYGDFAERDAASLIGALVAGTWTAAPVVAAACFVAASRTRLGARFYFTVQLALIASFAWEFYQVWYVHPSSTGGFVFFTWPLLQWGTILVVAGVAAAFGWRAKESWLST
jgi:hypothetical protein